LPPVVQNALPYCPTTCQDFSVFYASLISPLSDILFYSDIHFFELDFDKVISIKNLYYYDGVADYSATPLVYAFTSLAILMAI